MPRKTDVDIYLPPKRNPTYGGLVAVKKLKGSRRELWFQSGHILRVVEVNLESYECEDPITIDARERRS